VLLRPSSSPPLKRIRSTAFLCFASVSIGAWHLLSFVRSMYSLHDVRHVTILSRLSASSVRHESDLFSARLLQFPPLMS